MKQVAIRMALAGAFALAATLAGAGTVRVAVTGADIGGLQERIDSVAAQGGGVVRVEAGEHEIRPLRLRSGVTLELADGARLLASTNLEDYVGYRAVVDADCVTNVALVGRGTIDGRGRHFREPKPLPGAAQPTVPMLLRFHRCKDVRIEGVTYRQSGSWGMHLRNCDGVVVRGVTCFNHNNRQNDGIDIESKNVLIEDCDIDSDDDAICFKAESDKSFVVENVRVRNCRLASTCNFIKFGTGSYGLWRNIVVENCTLCRPAEKFRFCWRERSGGRGLPGVTNVVTGLAGIALELADGGRMEDVTVRDITMTGGVGTPLFARLERRHKNEDGVDSNFRNVVVERVRMTEPAESRIASSITGVPGMNITGITVRDCEFLFPGGGTFAEADETDIPENEKGYPEFFMFGKKALPAFGLYLRHADGIVITNVSLRTVSPDARPPIVGPEDPDTAYLRQK